MTATSPFTLEQDTGQHARVFFFLPIYHYGLPGETPGERWTNLQGFGLLILRIDDTIQKLLYGKRRAGLTLSVTDEAAPPEEGLLYEERTPVPADTLRWVQTVSIANRRWRFEFSFLPASAQWTPPLASTIAAILIGGLSLTTLLAAYFFSSAHRTTRLAQAA